MFNTILHTDTVTPAVTPPWTPTNDTLIGDYSSYLRWSAEESTYQMSSKIDPRTEGEGVWMNIPSSVYDAIHPEGGGKTLTIGQLITRLSQQERMHHEEVKAHNKLRTEAQGAIQFIGERLIEESERRDWCSEFDSIIDDVNMGLPAWGQLPDRTREYTVTWSEEYRVTVQRQATVATPMQSVSPRKETRQTAKMSLARQGTTVSRTTATTPTMRPRLLSF